MTDNELKKIREKISCPQFGDEHYGEWGALRLEQRRAIYQMWDEINRQKAENSNLSSDLTSLQNDLTSAKAEIERLEKDRKENFEMWKKLCEQSEEKHEKMFQEAKATIRPKAIKEFAERLKVIVATHLRGKEWVCDG